MKEAIVGKNPKNIGKLTKGLFSDDNARISNKAVASLLGIATVADLVTLIPVAGDFVGPIFWVCVAIYLWKKGCGLVNVRRLVTELISMVGEMIPVVQEFPLIIAGTALVMVLIRFEDKTGINPHKNMAGKSGGKMSIDGRREAPPRIPVNQGNVRPPNGGLAN